MCGKKDQEYETYEEYLGRYFPKPSERSMGDVDPYQLGANFAREVITKYSELAVEEHPNINGK